MDALHAHDLIDFAVRWLPYGGAGGEEIWITFGLNAVDFRRQLRAALDLPHSKNLGKETIEHLYAYTQLRRHSARPLVGQ